MEKHYFHFTENGKIKLTKFEKNYEKVKTKLSEN